MAEVSRNSPVDALAEQAHIKAEPYTAVAIALATGYLLGRVGRHV
jgi:ElaB/YqjD/DUF883 family membrane-anchored ribosome-binding protein